MTQKENQLLLKDLCARLPYGLKVKCEKYPFPVTVLYAGNINEVKFVETGGIEHICLIKPYLRPMLSMTEKEKEDFGIPFTSEGLVTLADTVECMDWLNAHHFDFRGLIPMGLAIEAPEGMYEIK